MLLSNTISGQHKQKSVDIVWDDVVLVIAWIQFGCHAGAHVLTRTVFGCCPRFGFHYSSQGFSCLLSIRCIPWPAVQARTRVARTGRHLTNVKRDYKRICGFARL